LRPHGAALAVVCLGIVIFAAGASSEVELRPDDSRSAIGSLLPTSGRASLLDPSKLDISHQMMFSYSSGNAGRNNVGGLWLTNLSYKFSSPLTLDLAVGASLSRAGTRDLNAQNLFLESFSLRYRPSENLYFHLMYREVPNSLFLRPELWAR
jgi:hypothetical protein